MWIEDSDETFNTSCGHSFVFNDGGPTENGFEYCPYCGGALTEELFLDE
jgi:hypothetical protein